MPAAVYWEPLSADQQARLRSMLQASVIFQVELWRFRYDISLLFGLEDDDDIDNLLDDLIGNFAADVPDGQRGLKQPNLDELVMYVESAADECRYRL